MTNHVFITHASEDRHIAQLMCEALEVKGVKCWYAPRDVPFGVKFEEAIMDAITSSRMVILILSAHSNSSRHVTQEIACACADDVQVPIIPFRIEDIRGKQLDRTLRYYLSSVQYVDALTPPLEDHFENLVNQVQARLLLQQSPQSGTADEEKETARSEKAPVEKQTAAQLPKRLYLDFDLLIDRAGVHFRARVIGSPGGDAAAEFERPFDDLELENFLLRIGRPSSRFRGTDSRELRAARDFGGRLFDSVFSGDIRRLLSFSLAEARQKQSGLRVRLRFADAPELADLPWEFLYDSTEGRFLVLSSETPLVRFIDLPEFVRPLEVKPPIRILAVIASPTDLAPMDVEQEKRKLKEALNEFEERGNVEVHYLEKATLRALQRRLGETEYHIFHFIGHGAFNKPTEEGILAFEDEDRRARHISSQYLGALLNDKRTLRLVFLSGCEGALGSFSATAQSLVQQGIPAVIAMQFDIPDEAAIAFTQGFYESITTGYPVDAALSEGRKAIYTQVTGCEWASPALYTRSPDGYVFHFFK